MTAHPISSIAGTCLTHKDYLDTIVNQETFRVHREDLNDGMMILWRRQFIDVDEKELRKKYKERFKRYDEALKRVYSDVNRGVTYLRKLIFEGMADKEIIPKKDLEKKIFDKGVSFSKDEISSVLSELKKRVDDVGIESLRKWINGPTTRPKNWDNLLKLVDINKEFAELHASYMKETGFHADVTYVHNVFAAFNRLRNRIKDDPEILKTFSRSDGPYISGRFSEELQWFIGEFFHNINEEVVAVRYRTPNRTERRQIKRSGTKDMSLYNGLYIGDINLPDTNLMKILEDRLILCNILGDLLIKEFHESLSKEDMNLLHFYAINLNFGVSKTSIGSWSKEDREMIKYVKEELYSRMINGDLDRKYDLEPGTVNKVLEAHRFNVLSTPKIFLEHKRLSDMLTIKYGIKGENIKGKKRKVDRRKMEEIKRMIGYYEILMRERYQLSDFDHRYLHRDIVFEALRISGRAIADEFKEKYQFERNILLAKYNDRLSHPDNLKDPKVYKRSEAVEVLRKNNIPGSALNLLYDGAFLPPLISLEKS